MLFFGNCFTISNSVLHLCFVFESGYEKANVICIVLKLFMKYTNLNKNAM